MIQLVRGFKDILPGEIELWQNIEDMMRYIFEDFGFTQIRTPILERTELFARGIGTTTDIVEKEMYTFSDQKNESLTMRPEATASVVRAYIEHKMYAKRPVQKLYTMGPMFRRERPQKGRYRQFYQINAEVFGLYSPKIDAELILILMTLMDRLSLTDVMLHINSLGCEGCRPVFKERLQIFLAERIETLCPDCRRRYGTNPLRIFDCKVPRCQESLEGAPAILNLLCEACQNHFNEVQDLLNRFQIPYIVNPRLVRGLDYYTRTAFEVLASRLGAQNAVAGGGRYDGLVKALGGPDQPGVGFAIGLDRLASLLADRVSEFVERPKVFIAALGNRAQDKAFIWLQTFRFEGIQTEMDVEDRSLKSQMRQADKLGTPYVLIVGDQELEEGVAVWRNMNTKEQKKVPLEEVIAFVKNRVADIASG
jgi:histidyl-tRNA synthetase